MAHLEIICIFAPIMTKMANEHWRENIILVDADYTDKVAFDLTVNFERMIGRRIPKADTARWIDCVALDGGIRQGDHETQVIFIHGAGSKQMENFAPGNYEEELDGKAFKDSLGEFTMSALPVEEITTLDKFFTEALQVVCASDNVKRVMVIARDSIYNKVKEALRDVDDEKKRVTVFAMQPMPSGNFRQEILGYSLMSALGIKGEEINPNA